MEENEVRRVIAQGEGQTIEFKRHWNAKEIDEVLISFANSAGGTLYIGINDDGSVHGIDPPEKWKEAEHKITSVCLSCRPPLHPEFQRLEYQGKTLMAVTLARSPDIHSTGGGTIYARTGSSTHPVGPEEQVRLLQDHGKLATDRFLVREARYSDLDEAKIKLYIERRVRTGGPRPANGRSIQKVAVALGLAGPENGELYPTVAGVLFFAHYPQQFLIQSTVRAVHFQGMDVSGRIILDRAGLTGDLDDMIDAAVRFVGRNMRVSRIVAEERLDIPEYPLAAVQEAIANAVVHRDYTNLGREVTLLMFDDRLEIKSPGGLAGPMTLENLDREHFARNPLLSTIAFELGKTEHSGSGISRIKQEMAVLGSPPPIFQADDLSFQVTLPARHPDVLRDAARVRYTV